MVADMEVEMEADMEVDKVADKVADIVADMAADKKRSWCVHENEVYQAEPVWCDLYPTCVSSKLCEFIGMITFQPER